MQLGTPLLRVVHRIVDAVGEGGSEGQTMKFLSGGLKVKGGTPSPNRFWCGGWLGLNRKLVRYGPDVLDIWTWVQHGDVGADEGGGCFVKCDGRAHNYFIYFFAGNSLEEVV